MADLLKLAKQRGTKKAKSTTKSDDRWTIKFDRTDENREMLEDLVELAHLSSEIDPLLNQRKTAAQSILFDMWTDKMWQEKSKPDNPRIVLTADGGMEDHRCMLQVKFRSDGLKNVLPKDISDEDTLHELLIEGLEAIGLSKKNARLFVDEEIQVKEQILIADLNDWYYNGTPAQKVVAGKLLGYYTKRSKTGKAQVDLITDDDLAALGEENEFVEEKQIVTLKDGVGERVWKYCDTLEQLRDLLKFCKVTIQISHFEYALSQTKREQAERAAKAAKTYLLATDGE